MAEPVPQVVAQMPKAKLIGLLSLFLGPAVVIYTAFSIYPLLATMQLATFAGESGGGFHFVGLANFQTLLTDALWSAAVLERVQEQHDLLRHPYGGAKSDRHCAGGPSQPART